MRALIFLLLHFSHLFVLQHCTFVEYCPNLRKTLRNQQGNGASQIKFSPSPEARRPFIFIILTSLFKEAPQPPLSCSLLLLIWSSSWMKCSQVFQSQLFASADRRRGCVKGAHSSLLWLIKYPPPHSCSLSRSPSNLLSVPRQILNQYHNSSDQTPEH